MANYYGHGSDDQLACMNSTTFDSVGLDYTDLCP